ncbi:MAG: LysE family transporter [Pseudomonadota bacterium]
MFDILNLASIALAFAIVAISPGPANLAVATVSMRLGRDQGMLCAFGLALGLAFWGLVAATGMGAVLAASETALIVLKLGGAAYLLYLAWQSGRAATTVSSVESTDLSAKRWFLRGLILNVSNPKAVVAWMAALSMGLGADDGAGQLLAATAICMVIGLLNYVGYAFVFSLDGAMSAYRRFGRWVDAVASGLFAVAGLGLLRSAISR